jgi:RimJ/RimL family protein N-acetyltransferase
MYSDAEVTHFLLGEPDTDVETTATRLRSAEQRSARGAGLGFWAIEERDSGRVAGAVILKPLGDTEEIEVGYHLARDSWGKGIATEAAEGALRHGFTTVGLDRIVAVVRPDNPRSLRVIAKLGMRHEGRRHHYGSDLEYFALGRDEWQARQNHEGGTAAAG